MSKRAVVVRDITARDGTRLKALAERSSCAVTRRRAHICWCSATGMSAPQIAVQFGYDVKSVRLVINAFNEGRFEALQPRYNGGRRPAFHDAQRAGIADMALAAPSAYGYPFTRWSLRKLALAAHEQGLVEHISVESVRRILREAGVSHQRTKTWKESTDPLFESKRRRIRRLYRSPPADGRVICCDEFGPLSIQPHHGSCWADRSRPRRLPATYRRTHGVRQMFAALDLERDQIYYRIKKRKRTIDFLGFLKTLRAIVPAQEKIYLVLDNLSAHLHRSVKAWARRNLVVLVFTPTNASWLNRIECHFAPIVEFVLRGSNYGSHRQLAAAMRRYIRWRNRNPANAAIRRVQNRVKVA